MKQPSEAEWLMDILERAYERWGKSTRFETVDPMMVLSRAALTALRRRGWKPPTKKGKGKK